MNRKMTPKVIKMIALQSIILIIAVTAIGGAIKTHDEFKATATKPATTQSEGNESVGEKSTSASTKKPEYNLEYSFAGLNPRIIDTSVGIERILLNGNNILPENYKPTLSPILEDSKITIDYNVAPYYRAMFEAAKQDGITLTPLEGYTSVKTHQEKFDEVVNDYIYNEGMDKTEAVLEAVSDMLLPGESEHNAGLAVDICSESASFEFTDEFRWLSENADDYGFILRYPKEGEEKTGVSYKPWHYRYVGIKAAQEISRTGITLEEYLEKNG